MKTYQNEICREDISFLNADKFTFSVLIRILSRECALTLFDKERLVVCLSAAPYPVWIWTPDGASEEEMERAYRVTFDHLPLSTHRFNMKRELAEYFIKRAAKDGIDMTVGMTMLAYSCKSPKEPVKKVDGRLEIAQKVDTGEVIDFIRAFHDDVGMDKRDDGIYAKRAEEYVSGGRFFFWKRDGVRVACCSYNEMEDQCSIASVMTKPEYRRSGYASRLVFEVAELIKEKGKLPTLYTDAGYSASNACYTGIGFVTEGELCNVGVAEV